MLVYRSGDKKPAVALDFGDWTRVDELKEAIAQGLDMISYDHIRVYSDKGQEIIDDEDVWRIPRNGILFITTHSNCSLFILSRRIL